MDETAIFSGPGNPKESVMSTPQVLKDEIESLTTQKIAVETGLMGKRLEAVTMLRTLVVDLLIGIRDDPTVMAKSLVIRKLRTKKQVVFEIALDESDLINRESYTETLASVTTLAQAAGIPPIIIEEK